jgi:hypothetical protein
MQPDGAISIGLTNRASFRQISALETLFGTFTIA